KQFRDSALRRPSTEPVQTREEQEVLFSGETPVETSLFGSGQANIAPHALIVLDGVVPFDRHVAGGRLNQCRYDFCECGLARAVLTNQPKDFAFIDGE